MSSPQILTGMERGILERGQVEITTSGFLMGSPIPQRRKFYVDVYIHPIEFFAISTETTPREAAIMALSDLKALLELAVPKDLLPYETYVMSFCKYCNRERGELCLRHRSVMEVPIGNDSNNEYRYLFDLYYTVGANIIIGLNFEVGRWQLNGAVIVNKVEGRAIGGALRVVRPSGRVFTYKLKPGKPSSVAYIILRTINFIDDVLTCLNGEEREECKWWYIYPKVW